MSNSGTKTVVAAEKNFEKNMPVTHTRTSLVVLKDQLEILRLMMRVSCLLALLKKV